MAARRAPARPAQPKPVSQAQAHSRRLAQDRAMQNGIVAAIILLALLPVLPSPIGPFPNPFPLPGMETVGPFDWRGALWEVLGPTLLMPIPPPDMGLPVPSVPLLRVLHFVVALLSLGFIATLIQHLQSIYAQRTRPLKAPFSYIRVMVPANTKLTPQDGVTLLRTLHGMLRPVSLVRGDPAPLVLRYIGRAQRPVEQGLSVCGPETLTRALLKTLEGLGRGTSAEVADDPFLAAVKPGRFLCWADVRLQGPKDIPIMVASRDGHPLLDALLPALLPMADVEIADVQLIMRPIADRQWRLPVLARMENLKLDTSAAERRAMEAKAAGPAFAVTMRFRAIATNPDAGAAMVQSMAATLASSAQAVATMQQRLVGGGPQILPAVLDPVPPFPVALRNMGLAVGGVVAAVAAALLFVFQAPILLSAVIPFLVPIPALGLAARHRKRYRADVSLIHGAVINHVMPPTNPRIVPLISDWLGPR